jgi:hypothetical protein
LVVVVRYLTRLVFAASYAPSASVISATSGDRETEIERPRLRASEDTDFNGLCAMAQFEGGRVSNCGDNCDIVHTHAEVKIRDHYSDFTRPLFLFLAILDP